MVCYIRLQNSSPHNKNEKKDCCFKTICLHLIQALSLNHFRHLKNVSKSINFSFLKRGCCSLIELVLNLNRPTFRVSKKSLSQNFCYMGKKSYVGASSFSVFLFFNTNYKNNCTPQNS